MKLLRGFQHIAAFPTGTIATIGNFDGIHKGHQALLAELRAQADRRNVPALVILFEPQPGEYFHGNNAPARLSNLREKLTMLNHCGIDFVYCLKFDKRLSLMSPEDFAQQVLFSYLNIKHLIIGRDFRFGCNRLGDVTLLNTMAIERLVTVQLFADFSITDERVSSTGIRHALQQGELRQASALLGRTFCLSGRVIRGDGRGRQWGIPTANLSLHRITLPLKGVFCVQVRRKGTLLPGVANIGSRPTVDGSKNILEVHLFDFDESLYGERVHVFFLHKLRDEMRFPSVDVLIAQIRDDVTAAKQYFAAAHAQEQITMAEAI